MSRLVLRFAVLILPLLFILSVLVSLVRTPPEDSGAGAIGFAACKLPCWAGITPGLTPFAEANELLGQHLPEYQIPTFLTTSTLTFQTIAAEPMISGSLFYDGTRVGEIHLDVRLPASYLLDRLGTPDCVWVVRGSVPLIVRVYWERNGLSTGAYFIFDRDAGWQRDMLTHYLQMSTTLSCDIPGILPWRGFARAWRYEEMASREAVP